PRRGRRRLGGHGQGRRLGRVLAWNGVELRLLPDDEQAVTAVLLARRDVIDPGRDRPVRAGRQLLGLGRVLALEPVLAGAGDLDGLVVAAVVVPRRFEAGGELGQADVWASVLVPRHQAELETRHQFDQLDLVTSDELSLPGITFTDSDTGDEHTTQGQSDC